MKQKEEFQLQNYSYFLEPVMLKDGKMYQWFSICSKHQSHNTECNLCSMGSWVEIKIVDENQQ